MATLLAGSAALGQTPPAVSGVIGSPTTFATHTQLASYGFSFGPSDGAFGAIPTGGGTYTFYGDAGSSAACAGTPSTDGAFSFTGTLDQVTGSNGCKRLFGPGDGPAGWVFDKNYAGGGQVVRFASGGKSGWLMPFHGEFWWQNLANPPSFKCTAGAPTSLVPCFYGSLGLAVSTDNGKTFQVAGQIFQPSQPLSFFTGGGTNMAVGYGSLIVADANGKHLDNPPADPSVAYFYLFYTDLLPSLPGACATGVCLGVARAPYADVINAAFSGDPHQVATVFHKYDGASPDPWTQPATSDTPDLSGTAGKYAPLWTNEAGSSGQVIYDSTFDVYLAVYVSGGGFKVRASSDLIHWSGPIAQYTETGRTLFYPTLMGETGDPTIAGPAPRVYFSSFPTGSFPNYATSVFESVPLTLSVPAGSPAISLSNTQLGFYYVTGGTLPAAQSIGVTNSGGGTLSWSASANVPWIALSETTNGFTVSVNPAGLAAGPHTGTISVIAPDATNNPQTVSVGLSVSSSVQVLPPSATRFVPITPCRIADTRNANGPFGGPKLPRQTARDFAVPGSACGIPSTAVAYSLNVAVVPSASLGFLTLWPTGQPQPLVATLNSIDGRVKSNAAIVPAGANGVLSVFVTDATDVILDINGYFVPASNASALAFYQVTPCRVADTRNAAGPLGGPSLAAQGTRSFPIQASPCGVPASAQAYSLNFAAVPKGSTLGFMTAWPAGLTRPLVASLNDPTGTVLANAVVVPGGTGGAVTVFSTDATDLVIDINGYFAPPGAGGLSLYTVAPCRVADTRNPAGSPPFNATRDFNVTAAPCGVPAAAQAFVFNATVVPPGFLGFITMWPQGQSKPLAATLNAYDGAVTNNMAIVPTTIWSISVFPSAPTHLVLDIFGYFAP